MDVHIPRSLALSQLGEPKMTTLVKKRNAAGDRYKAALAELRAAFVDLSALDRLCQAPSFGPPPDIVPLRHPTFAANISGSFTDGIADAIAAHS
jgi:hypothetical protein